MMQMVEANWLAFALALLIGLLVAWWLFRRGSTAAPRAHRPDVLDEGAAPAARNQALIDAAPAAEIPTILPSAFSVGMGGLGEVIAVAAQDNVEEAEAVAQATGPADDLLRIKGVGPKLVALLASLGVTRFAQIAAWDEAEIDRIDAQLGPFEGRIRRDSWAEQANFLAAGDVAGFEGRFGKL